MTLKYLKRHILEVHENIEKKKTHICEVCGKGFSAPSLLTEHAMTHVAKKQIQCDICGKWVKNQRLLGTHKQIHVQTPMKCPHCDKIKFNKHALNSHISLVHSVKKHQCTICTKSFSRPVMLRVR